MADLPTQNWQQWCDATTADRTQHIWVTVGNYGYSGSSKHARQAALNELFGADGWKISHIVRGRIVAFREAIWEYEQSYRVYLQAHPEMVDFLACECGNVYDYAPENVYDDDYLQPNGERNHYQDISVRRVIAEMIDDPRWHNVKATPQETVPLINLSDQQVYTAPRARGFSGKYLLEIRGAESPGFFLNPAVVPAYDPALVVTNPRDNGWYLAEGCGYLSAEAFWQSSKVIQARYDRFTQLGARRNNPLKDVLAFQEFA